jgi:hypothetical protein
MSIRQRDGAPPVRHTSPIDKSQLPPTFLALNTHLGTRNSPFEHSNASTGPITHKKSGFGFDEYVINNSIKILDSREEIEEWINEALYSFRDTLTVELAEKLYGDEEQWNTLLTAAGGYMINEFETEQIKLPVLRVPGYEKVLRPIAIVRVGLKSIGVYQLKVKVVLTFEGSPFPIHGTHNPEESCILNVTEAMNQMKEIERDHVKDQNDWLRLDPNQRPNWLEFLSHRHDNEFSNITKFFNEYFGQHAALSDAPRMESDWNGPRTLADDINRRTRDHDAQGLLWYILINKTSELLKEALIAELLHPDVGLFKHFAAGQLWSSH